MSENDFLNSPTLKRNSTLATAFEKLREKEEGKGVELTDYEAQHVFEHLKSGLRARDAIGEKRDLENTLNDMRREYVREGRRELAKDIEWQATTVRIEREKFEKVVNGHVGGQYW